MKKVIHIIADTYNPNTATFNRIYSFVKGFVEQDIIVKIVFAMPNDKKQKSYFELENIESYDLWHDVNLKNIILKHIGIRINLIKYIFSLEKNENVIFYNAMDYLWVSLLRRDVNFYHERTEFPKLFINGKHLFKYLNYWQYKISCKKLSGLFCISPSIKSFFVNEYNIKSDKVHVINMTVDIERFENVSVSSQKDVISYCGNISVNKDGILDLLEAFKLVNQSLPNFKLQIIGKFESESTKQKVFKILENNSIKDNVVFTGLVSSEIMPNLLKSSKVLVLSRPKNLQSTYGFPTKLGEYLMTGNPIIITRVGDIDKYLNDYEDVIFSKPDDVVDFSEKIKWVINNYSNANNIGENGRNKALKIFNYKIESKKVIDIIYSHEN